MARSFDGTDDWIGNSTPPLLGNDTGAFTVAFWFRALTNARTNDYVCSGLGRENCGAILYEYVDNNVEFYNGAGSGTDPRTGSGLVVADTNWHHIAWRKAASGASEWAKYLDGSKTVINASISFSINGISGSHWKLGSASAGASGASDYANIELARFGVWASAVDDSHIEEMAKGISPMRFRPTHYWELMGNKSPETSPIGSASLTVTGATKADHPRGEIFGG
jgi:hypothetical protein